jgi:citrate lyase gamma subunit|tara:strand:- start:16 stop:396 length:381 start_codon:yes stop_codon:yes gene_type:complete
MKKLLLILGFVFIATFAYPDVMQKIDNDCKSLGFVEGSLELSKCKLELLVLEKKLKLENTKLEVAKAHVEAAKQTAIATEAQARAAAATARASESIAHSEHWRNSRSLSRQGLRMLSGACTLGKNC